MTTLVETLYSAAHSPLGVVVRTSDFEAARQRLYAERRRLSDPSLNALAICQSPSNPSDLWIVKKAPADAQPEA